MIVKSFFEAAESSKFLFASVLFWKSRHDCLMLTDNGADEDDHDIEYDSFSSTPRIVIYLLVI